jgi:ParB/RepB/Spo0J family partition protein
VTDALSTLPATAGAPGAAATSDREPVIGAVHIPLELLKASATNPRKAFNDTWLRELADSIRTHGLLQPIVARPIEGARRGEPLYEIVCGEQRWRASKLAETGSIMALVRSMTDFEVLEVQIIENLKRTDLTELEEAEGYSKLLRTPTGLQGYANVDELAARVGKSRSYVYQRMQLLRLVPEARSALEAGKLSFSVALLVARLHDAADQAKATKELLQGWGGQPLTHAQAVNYIHRTFHLTLARALFDLKDASLVPAAGACTACPKRTSANPELFTDVHPRDDQCTDSACWQSKEEAHRAAQRRRAEAEGRDVITGKEAKKVAPTDYGSLKGYLELDKVHHTLGDKPLRKLLGQQLPEVKLLEKPGSKDLVEVVSEKDALAALKARGVLAQAKMPSKSPDQRKAEEKRLRELEYRKALASELVEAAPALAAADAVDDHTALLQHVALELWALLSADDCKRVEALMAWERPVADHGRSSTKQRIAALRDGDFARYLVAVISARDMYVGPYSASGSTPERMHALAPLLGVDPAALKDRLRELRKVPKAKPPAKATKPAATPETALAVALKKAKTSKVATKYVDPKTGNTWSGRGLQPKWVRAWLEGGGTLAELQAAAEAKQPPTAKAPETPRPTLSPNAAWPFRRGTDANTTT